MSTLLHDDLGAPTLRLPDHRGKASLVAVHGR